MEKKIIFNHVSKTYKINNNKKRLLDYFMKKNSDIKKKVLDDINFSISKGEKVVILGKNGAGKSTILKMISGVTYPSKGEVMVHGTVNALLELNSGFEQEFTGRENIYLKGTLIGLTPKEIKEKEETIIRFADIGDYMDYPIKTYSTGMKARLGFSIAIHIDPDILVIDEALSVGDQEFREKCLNKLNEITSEKGVTLILVTHSFEMAENFCSRGIVLEQGKITFDGQTKEALKYYGKTIRNKE